GPVAATSRRPGHLEKSDTLSPLLDSIAMFSRHHMTKNTSRHDARAVLVTVTGASVGRIVIVLEFCIVMQPVRSTDATPTNERERMRRFFIYGHIGPSEAQLEGVTAPSDPSP